jgi:lysylphosphatidylglycerol synthetase-like protein (DUF2156 family)
MVSPERQIQDPVSFARLRELVERHSDHPSIDLVFNQGNRYFTTRDTEGFVAYREAGGVLYQFAGAVAPAEQREELLRSFLAFARDGRRRIFAVQLRREDVEMYLRNGFRLNEMGRSYTLRLKGFSLRGHKFMKLRNKLKQPVKNGVEVFELGRDLDVTADVRARLQAITDAWLRAKGRHVKLLEFLVGETGSVDRPGSRCFVAVKDAAVIAFITYVPSYGRYRGLMHDLTRRMPDAPPGTMELINYTAIERFQQEGIDHLNFGFTPFIGVDDQIPDHSPVVARTMKFLGRHGSAIYPAQAQVDYKLKWDPDVVEPEFMAFENRFRVSDLWHLLRVTRSI